MMRALRSSDGAVGRATAAAHDPRRHDTCDDLLCPTCGYCLRGLASRICPECGGAFDPEALGAGAGRISYQRTRDALGRCCAVAVMLYGAMFVADWMRYTIWLDALRFGWPRCGTSIGSAIGIQEFDALCFVAAAPAMTLAAHIAVIRWPARCARVCCAAAVAFYLLCKFAVPALG